MRAAHVLRWRRRLATAVVLAALLSFGAAGAAAAPGWKIQATPNVGSPTLYSVSCPAANACTAVGRYVNAAGTERTLAQRWNGTSWKIQPTPNPTGACCVSDFAAVSCATANACTAVGSYIEQATASSDGKDLTLAERWNGTSWKIQPTPNPADTQSFFGIGIALSGVSCPAANVCTAVGKYKNGAGTYVTLAERWNGTSWKIQPTPNPAGAAYTALSGVSCKAANACTAVGSYRNSADKAVTLAERWNGTSWKIQPTPNPAGSGIALNGVSCTAASVCTAVGGYYNAAGKARTLAERWNGTSWKIQPTPNPAGAPGLNGVSCKAANACTAVGGYSNVSGKAFTLAERWNGTSWKIQSTPNPAGNFPTLYGVSCPAAKACTAVGRYLTAAGAERTLAERWNG
jgi:hypothetical protein